MLEGLMAALLQTNKSVYGIGEYPAYLITGATPYAQIAWTSWFNGKPTLEFEQLYGQYVESDGTAAIIADMPFDNTQIGTWRKQVALLNPNGTVDRAEITFTVSSNGQTVAPVTTLPPTRPVIRRNGARPVEVVPVAPGPRTISDRPPIQRETPTGQVIDVPPATAPGVPRPPRTISDRPPIQREEPTGRPLAPAELPPPILSDPLAVPPRPGQETSPGGALPARGDTTQTQPSSGAATVNLFGYDVPVIALVGGVVLLIFMGGGRR